MGVKLSQLRAFREVAKSGSFTRAAERMSLTQPTLSMAIRELEQELGLKLLNRTTRSVAVTDEGANFLPIVSRLLEEFDAAVADAQAVAERRRGSVSLAVLPSVSAMLLPKAIATFSSRYPSIRVAIREDNSSEIHERVARKEVDFGVAGSFGESSELGFEPILTDRFGVVFRSDHVLAGRQGPAQWHELSRHRLIGLAADTGIQPLIHRTLSIKEEVRAPSHEVSNILTALSLVEAGLGVAAIPAFAAMKERNPHIRFRPLVRPVLTRRIGIITRRGMSLSPAAESMRKEIIEAVAGVLREPDIFIENSYK